MSNKVGYYTITTTYIGTLFGAGFVSGQEIFQFFGCSPTFGIYGGIILSILVFIFSFIAMHSSYLSKPTSFEQLLVADNKALKYLINLLFIVFSCGILVIMFAGAGTLFSTLFNTPNIFGSIIMATVVLFIGLGDTSRITKTFKYLTPIMFIIAITTTILGIIYAPTNNIITSAPKCLKNSWLLSSILYFTYNYFLAIAILMPLGKKAKSQKEILKGALLSAITLGITSIMMIVTLLKNYSIISNAEMPMHKIAVSIHPIVGNIYAVVLFCGIFAASIGMLFAILNYFKGIDNKTLNNKKVIIPLLCLGAIMLSNFGFSKLISTIYPTLGYIGLVSLIGLIYQYIKNYNKFKSKKANMIT